MAGFTDDKLQAAIMAAAPKAMATLCELAANPKGSVISRLKSAGLLVGYSGRVNWKADAGRGKAIASFLLAVAEDGNRAESTRHKAATYLAAGVKSGIWKAPA